MGEENRGSSGGGTAMIVVVILGGLLLVGCSCGGIVVGVSFLMYSSAREVEMKAMDAMQAEDQAVNSANQELQKANKEFDKAMEKVRRETEAIKIPDGLVPNRQPSPDNSPPSTSSEKE